MKLEMFCPKRKCGGSIDVVVCLYTCPIGTRIKCNEYTRKWDKIKDIQMDQFYLDKYGEPKMLVPLTLRKRRKLKVNLEPKQKRKRKNEV